MALKNKITLVVSICAPNLFAVYDNFSTKDLHQSNEKKTKKKGSSFLANFSVFECFINYMYIY